MTKPIPPTGDLMLLIQESRRNAADLLDDARVLLDAGRAPRAHALATLALEELGKSSLCMIACGFLPITGGNVYGPGGEGFWDAWQRHPIKLFWVRSFLAMIVHALDGPVEATARRLADEARADHLRKLRGLYVDYEDGNILLPSEITQEAAQELIGDAELLIEIFDRSWGSDGADSRALDLLANQGPELAALAQTIAQAMTADPEATVRAVHTIFRQNFGAEIPELAPLDDLDQRATKPAA